MATKSKLELLSASDSQNGGRKDCVGTKRRGMPKIAGRREKIVKPSADRKMVPNCASECEYHNSEEP